MNQKPTKAQIEAFVKAGFTAADIAVFQGWTVAKTRYWLKKFDLKAAKENGSIGAKSLKFILQESFPAYPIKEEYHIGNRLRLDFYIPALHTAFEVDGSQHTTFVAHWHHGQVDKLLESQKRDEKKDSWCEKNNILLIRLPDSAVVEACRNHEIRKVLMEAITDKIAEYKPTGPEKKEKKKPVSQKYLEYQERMKTLSRQARKKNYQRAKELKDKLKGKQLCILEN